MGVYRKKRRKRLQSVKGLDERERENREKRREKNSQKKKNKELLASCSSRVVFFILSFMANRRRSEISSHENKSTLCLLSLGTS